MKLSLHSDNFINKGMIIVEAMEITDREGFRYFPAVIYQPSDKELKNPLQEIAAVYEVLSSQGKVFVVGERKDAEDEALGSFQGMLAKESIYSIVPAVPKLQHVNLELVMSLSEAAEKWGLSDGSSIRKAIERKKFRDTEVKCSGSIWLVTYQGMQRVFGQVKSTTVYSINKDELDALLFRAWLLDGNLKNLMPNDLEVRNNLYTKIVTMLEEAYRCLLADGKLLFKSRTGKINMTIDAPEKLIEWVESLENFGMNTTKSKEIILKHLQSISKKV